MKKVWSAKVHTSGDRIQLLKNGSVTKVIRASAETFAPVAAKEFAESLVNQLNTKYAKQMTDPSKDPSVATEGEQHEVAMKAINRDAKGISVKEASIQSENLTLKKKIASLEKEAMVERKARRGLAIVKTLVDQKKIANDQTVIKSEVMKIVAMSNDEIGLLERKVAGKPLYDSKEDANIASVRYARMSRLHHQAAEDAHLAGNLKLADDEDLRADRYENLAKQAYAASNEYAQYNAEADKGTSEDIANQIDKTPKGVDAKGKIASDDNDDDDIDEDELIDSIDEDDIDDDEDMQVEASVAIYKKIAAEHRKKAEDLKLAGNDEDAATECEIADEADELADSIDDDDNDEEEYSKEAAAIYRRIASEHRKKADEFESAGDDVKADIEDEIADEAEQLAASVESSMSKCSETSVASKEDAVAVPAPEEVPVAKEAEAAAPVAKEAAPVPAPVEVPAPVAKEAEVAPVAAVVEKKAEEEMPEIMKNAEPTTDTDTIEETDEDANDPLAALLDETEKEAANEVAEEIEEDDSMPTDDEITAAVAGDSSIEEESDEEAIDKDAGATATKKIANEGYSKTASSLDKLEQNPMTHDSQVRELEDFWRHDSKE